jgi:hypothetical protein
MLLKRWYKWFSICTLLIGVLPLSALAAPSFSPAETFVVTNINDSGEDSLRQAILDANAHSGSDRIEFDIPSGPGPDGMYVILVEDLLPPLTDPVTIDGTSQEGFSLEDGPVVEITGTQLEKSCAGVESGVYRDFPGLDIVNNSDGDASGTTIKGLKVSHFCQGISITASFDHPQLSCLGSNETELRISNVTVQGNRIEGNLGGNGAVDLCFTENSTIKNNTFLNNGDHLEITRSQDVFIEGNEGTDAQDALELVRSQRIIVKHNRFTNTRRNGIVSVFEASNNRILYNEVTNVAAIGITLGNDNIAKGNTIIGAGWFGIAIRGGSNNIVSENIVQDNGLGGIAVSAGTFLFLAECSIDPSGNPFDCGVSFPLVDLNVEGDAFNNIIRNNEIAYNHGPGIVVGGRFEDFNGNERRAAHNRLSGNIIYANEGLGIDLSDETQSVFFAAEEPIVGAFGEIVLAKADGVTLTDSAILANDGQNFPVLTSARATPGRLVVRGTIDTPDPSMVTIEFFANPVPTPGGDPSGHGEGAVFLGKARPDGQGNFTVPLPPVPVGTLITATATDADGNTSEFAENIEAQFRPGR